MTAVWRVERISKFIYQVAPVVPAPILAIAEFKKSVISDLMKDPSNSLTSVWHPQGMIGLVERIWFEPEVLICV